LARAARERIDDALARLDGLDDASPAEIEEAVHEVRKRCKEVRGLAELIRPALGRRFRSFNSPVRSAAAELSSIRDAHAVLDTFDRLRAAQVDLDDPSLDPVRARLAHLAAVATRDVAGGDQRLENARVLLRAARSEIDHWKIPSGFAPVAAGLRRTYERGARQHAEVERRPTDERMHEWRKETKRLWYQLRLLREAAPSVLDPAIDVLHALGDALGDDHDLAVLVAALDADPAAYGGEETVERAISSARAEQEVLRSGAIRLGATVYAESGKQFTKRMRRYWETTVEQGPELDVGGIEHVSSAASSDGDDEEHDDDGPSAVEPEPQSTIERERKWLVRELPDLDQGAALRQGYLAIDGAVSVRVRDEDGHRTLTVKAGAGTSRTELEWRIDVDAFEAAWLATEGRRITKTRHRFPLDDHTAEIDVFGEQLDGLVVVEVEFESDDELTAFSPPEWFGREVSDDRRYTNASMAVDGLDPSLFT
jgi:CYTH domain-containing protein/CHAD domain-containing protein